MANGRLKMCVMAATFAATVLHVSAAVGQIAASDVVSDPEAYAVYAAVLATGWPKAEIPKGTVAIEEKTRGHAICASWGGALGAGWQTVVESYQRENTISRRLLPGFDLGAPYDMITSEKYEDLIMIAAGDMKKVYADYHGGMGLAFSAVGFDSSKTHAMVSLQYSCQEGCTGGGGHFLLEKPGDRWRIADENIPPCTWTATD
jgi:hypothetical protein